MYRIGATKEVSFLANKNWLKLNKKVNGLLERSENPLKEATKNKK